MADLIRQTKIDKKIIRMNFGIRGFLKCEKFFDWDKIYHTGVFGVANYEFELQVQKFKIADPIWQTQIAKRYLNGIKYHTRWLLGSLITNLS